MCILNYRDVQNRAIKMIKNKQKFASLTAYALPGRWLNFEGAWKKLYEVRWGDCGAQIHSISWLAKQFEAKHELRDDWQQMYWERHLQKYLHLIEWDLLE